MNQTLKRHLVSAGITFFVGFAIVFVSDIDKISLDMLKDGSYVGLLFAAVRAGIKALLELAIATYRK